MIIGVALVITPLSLALSPELPLPSSVIMQVPGSVLEGEIGEIEYQYIAYDSKGNILLFNSFPSENNASDGGRRVKIFTFESFIPSHMVAYHTAVTALHALFYRTHIIPIKYYSRKRTKSCVYFTDELKFLHLRYLYMNSL